MTGPFAAVGFAGLRFTPLSVEETVAALAARPGDAPFAAFVTPNAEHAWLRRTGAEFRACSDSCWISTNDSRLLGRAARLGGLDLKFAPGAYVVRDLFEQVIGPEDSLTVVGGSEEVIADLREKFGLNRLSHHNPPMGFIHRPEAVREAIDFVASHPARFVFVAMGPPQSEIFCQRVIQDGRSTGVGLCIGSSINVITGHSDPAPDWMESSGLVWLYRLVREPRRLWRRYLVRGMYGLAHGLWDAVLLRLGLKRASLGG
jgi:exopolysaccharide biosynthesis WecB/TagA/CpsF family protein